METTCTLKLISVTDKVAVITWLRSELSISRSKADGLIDLAPSILASNLHPSVAERYAQELRDLGAVVEITEESVTPKVEVKEKPKKITQNQSMILAALLFIILFAIVLSLRSPKLPESEWKSLLGNVYTGVVVYSGFGETKSKVFTIVGASDMCSFGPGMLVLFPSGSVEWKDRNALIDKGYLFVKSDDPALEKMRLDPYPCDV